jgi:hypothetical protein
MSKPFHPAPWSARNGFVYDADGKLVASVRHEKTAAMIATTPELLSALEQFVDRIPESEIDEHMTGCGGIGFCTLCDARAAILKAVVP